MGRPERSLRDAVTDWSNWVMAFALVGILVGGVWAVWSIGQALRAFGPMSTSEVEDHFHVIREDPAFLEAPEDAVRVTTSADPDPCSRYIERSYSTALPIHDVQVHYAEQLSNEGWTQVGNVVPRDEVNPIAAVEFRMHKDFGDWSAQLAVPVRYGGYGVAVIVDSDGYGSYRLSCFD